MTQKGNVSFFFLMPKHAREAASGKFSIFKPMGTGKMDFFLSLLVLKREKRSYLK